MNVKDGAKATCAKIPGGGKATTIMERKGYGIGRIPSTGEVRDSKICSGRLEQRGDTMVQRKATRQEVVRERSAAKVQAVIKEKGYKSGKLPEGKELHHVKPVAEGEDNEQEHARCN